MRRTLALLLLAGLLAAIGGSAAGGAPAAAGKGTRLQAFGSCAQLLSYVKPRAAKLAGSWGLPWLPAAGARDAIGMPSAAAGNVERAAAPVQGVDFSGTNVQEEGVDEPDIVKTNGSTLFYARGDRLFAVDVRSGAKPRLLGSLKLEGVWSHELLLHGERLLVLSRGGVVGIDPPPPVRAAASMIARPYMQQTVLSEVAVGDPAAMRIVRSLVVDGAYVSARLVGGTARIVTVSETPQKLGFRGPDQPTAEAAAAAARRNRALIASSRVGSWLPRLAVRGRKGETLVRKPLVGCRDVSRPAAYSGLGLLTVLTIDLAKGLAPVDSDAIMAGGSTVYASPDTLYVATQRWAAQPEAIGGGEPPKTTTEIHSFDISSPERTTYRGSGTVSGYLLSQWSLSEHEGVLRVASTEEPAWWGQPQVESESFVTTLRHDGGKLAQVGRVGGLGKGERVYAVRFLGDRGYVVTFRQVDPLYTLDLSQPASPRVLGELKILGYSAYLHPLGDDLLLGVGQDADADGRVQGTQLSVFDVSDPRRPTRLHHRPLGPGWSEAESDHHAFLYWPRERLVVLPLQTEAFAGAAGFRVGRAGGIEELGRIEQGLAGAERRFAGTPVRRSVVVGGSVYAVSDAGVQAAGVRTFADLGWAGFPTVEQQGGGTAPGR